MAALVQEAHIQHHICKTALHYMPRRKTPFVKLNLFQFIHNYFRNTNWFTFHRLPICLNSAGVLAQAHITYIPQYICLFGKDPYFKPMPIAYGIITHTGIDILHACTTTKLCSNGKGMSQAPHQAYSKVAQCVQKPICSRRSASHNAYHIFAASLITN